MSAVLRSEGLIPEAFRTERHAELARCCAAGMAAPVSAGFLISLLLDDGRIVQAASSETALDQQVMQVNQRRDRHARRADRHPGAGGSIQHPCRHHDDHAGRDLDVNDITASPPLGILAPNARP